MEIHREVTVRLTSEPFSPEGWAPGLLRIEVEILEGKGAVASLIDYDESVGAVAFFTNEAEAVAHLDAFRDAAIPAYVAKHAKYGKLPEFRLTDGKLAMSLLDEETGQHLQAEEAGSGFAR
jgi:hypothetical protein